MSRPDTRSNRFGMACAALIAAAGSTLPALGQCTPEWLTAPNGSYASASYGTDMPVDACTSWLPPGTTVPRLVIGGRFASVAGGSFSHVAYWDGSTWNQLGSGLSGDVMALFDFNGTLVATGNFTGPGGITNIASWNGSSWQQMGTLNDYGTSLAMHSGFLYVGGNFTSTNAGAANHLAQWNGSSWQAINGGLDGPVTALGNFPVSGSSVESLIIGGTFTHANGIAANRIAGLNLGLASRWYALGTGTNGQVFAIKEGLGNLYIGGTFTTAGGIDTGGFARWNGFSWQANGGHFAGAVYALENYFDSFTGTNQMVVGGFYPGINNSPSIAYYNGTSYTTPGTGGMGPSGSVFCMTNYNSSLIVGGGFLTAGGVNVANLARWSGNPSTATTLQRGWTDLRPSPSAPVRALLSSGSSLFVGGDFTFTIDSADTVGHLYSTDGTTNSVVTQCFGCGLANGTDGSIRALANDVTGNILLTRVYLILGGNFTQAGGFPAANIAQFSFTGGYAAMGTGTDGQVNAIIQYPATRNSPVYATGLFANAGGVLCNHIAKWAGSWSALGTGLSGAGGNAMAIFNNLLYVGGSFSAAGGTPASDIATWNGTAWSAVDATTFTGAINALTVFNGGLVAAGSFASGSPVLDRVAVWNGTAWAPMSAGLPAATLLTPTSLTVHNGDLYLGAAPAFSAGPGSPVTVYHWNGSAWNAVPGSPLRPVYALASAAGDLWAGGDFGVANGHATPYLAKLQCACYVNCDNSATSPILNANDFQCFLNAYAAGDSYANCDGSTVTPVLNANDFQCFLNAYAAGCQ